MHQIANKATIFEPLIPLKGVLKRVLKSLRPLEVYAISALVG